MSETPRLDSTDLFEKLFELSPDAMVVVNGAGTMVQVNAQAQQMFGYARRDLLGQRVEMLMPERFRGEHPEHRAVYSAASQVRPMGAGLELFGRRADGKEFPVDIMLSPMEAADGPVVLCAIRDISERKRAEAELERSEEKFRLFVESVRGYAIFQLDAEGRIRTWNAAAQRMKGYEAEEIVGRHFSCLYAPEDLANKKPERELQAAAETGRSEDEGWRLRRDGSRFWAHVTITPIRERGSGTLVGFVKITRDETARRNAEEGLQRSEEHARMLFDLSPDAVFVCDVEGRIQEANARVEALFGYKREELLGQAVEVLVPERFHGEHVKHRKGYAAEPRMRPMGAGLHLYGRRKDGSEFPVDILLGPVERESGKIVFVVVRDLSERKRYEEALRRSEEEKRYLEEELTTTHHFEEIIGNTSGLKRVLKQVETVAPTDATVLILGETGTGKELIARAIHNLSSRREYPFVRLNCSAIPAGLLESELFGHEKGAFTGAIAQKVGRLELAHRGTLFLDEIGDLPLELQPKILRALQEKEFERLGGTRTIPVNVRLVAATNRDLAKMVEEKQFRSDLYYRLRVFPLEVPPLRERLEDIPMLVKYFVSQHARRMKREIESIPPEIMEALVRWRWPGNVRELENFIERAVILSPGPALRAPLKELQVAAEVASEVSAKGSGNLQDVEREHILQVLREAKGMISGPSGAAKRLGLKRTTLNSKLKKLGIKRSDYI
jgi:formate hydrogenlyase transcriptional activator